MSQGASDRDRREVGIDALGVYTPRLALSLEDLARARGIAPEKVTVGLGAHTMAVAPPWEDAVTLGASAAARALARGGVAADEIGLLLLATETAVDHAKPASIFLHELLGLPTSCRTFELKHACYGGTAGLMVATEWLRSGAARGRKALVVASDIARYDIGSSAELTQGAGAAALVVSEAPRLLRLDPASGVYASQVYDFWRPLDRREALVDGKFSLDCYLTALDGALADYHRSHAGHAGATRDAGAGSGGSAHEREDAAGAPLADRLAAFLYHTPFPKMAYKAHLRLMESEWRRWGRAADLLGEAAERSYSGQVEPWLTMARQVGNTYTASLYLCLAWLAEQQGRALAGREIALFSYGSGCCAELFTGHLQPGCGEIAATIGAADLLRARRLLSVEEYEALSREAGGSRAPEPHEAGFCHLAAIRDHKRIYERAACPA